MSQQNHRRLKQVKKTATSEFLEGSSDVTNNGDAGDVTCNVVALRDSRERWAVVPYVSLPDFLRDNEYLLKGHRPQLPTVKECFKSMFRHHTETWNIWTHFFGMFLQCFYYWFYLDLLMFFKGTHTVYFSSSLYIINQKPMIPRTYFHCKTT